MPGPKLTCIMRQVDLLKLTRRGAGKRSKTQYLSQSVVLTIKNAMVFNTFYNLVQQYRS